MTARMERTSVEPTPPALAVPGFVRDALRGPGRSLEPDTRRKMEKSLGHDFGKVRIHDGQDAAQSAAALGAAAYTVGNDIAFPRRTSGSIRDQELLAHELAHVIQQEGGGLKAHSGRNGIHEQEAAAASRAALSNTLLATVFTRTGIGLACAPEHGAEPDAALQPIPDGIPLYFPQGLTELRRDAEVDSITTLMHVIAAVKVHLGRRPNATIVISGYASEEGSPDRNVRLSKRRAVRVHSLLVEAGIPADRMVAVGRGVGRVPPGGRWNRRVLVEVPYDSSLDPAPAKNPLHESEVRGFTRKEGALYERLEDHSKPDAALQPIPDGIPLYFPQGLTELRRDAEVDSITTLMHVIAAVKVHLGRRPNATIVISGYASEEGSPDHNVRLSKRRAVRVHSLLVEAGIPADRMVAVGRGVGRVPPGRRWNRRVLVEVPYDSSLDPAPAKNPLHESKARGFTRKEGALYERLEFLSNISQREGPEGVKFAAAVMDFRAALRARVMTVNEGDPLPPDLAIVMQSLAFWSADQGQQWGKGIWDSKDFTPSAAEYSIVLASRYKCNIYVAEILNRVVGTVHTVHWSAEQSGRFFPYRANEWGDISRNIPHYPVVNGEKRKLGDIWALGDHMGIYLGTYAGVGIYISARDDGDGVFALDKVQHEHGIQIKFVKPGGTYRRYVP